ncbi:MAG: transposase [Syntrophomonadaceae bacterium]|nr:transposase [Syntrophomonadaceae bacterium]
MFVPRRAREKSNSGIYHIFLRGINRQNIFEDGEDNQKFLDALQRYKEICGYSLYAYCLMGNHVHLLLQVGIQPLAQFMRRICGSYVYWYNNDEYNLSIRQIARLTGINRGIVYRA